MGTLGADDGVAMARMGTLAADDGVAMARMGTLAADDGVAMARMGTLAGVRRSRTWAIVWLLAAMVPVASCASLPPSSEASRVVAAPSADDPQPGDESEESEESDGGLGAPDEGEPSDADGSAQPPAGIDPDRPDDADASEPRGARSVEPRAGDDAAGGRGDRDGALRDEGVISGSIGDLVRGWDRLNRAIHEADRDAIDRVAAETEQFAVVRAADGSGVFSGGLTETAVLGGTVTATGSVTELIALAVMTSSRDVAVASTTLRFALDDLERADQLLEIAAELASAEPGRRATFVEGESSVVVIERLAKNDGLVSIAFALDGRSIDFERRAAVLGAAMIASMDL